MRTVFRPAHGMDRWDFLCNKEQEDFLLLTVYQIGTTDCSQGRAWIWPLISLGAEFMKEWSYTPTPAFFFPVFRGANLFESNLFTLPTDC